MALEHSPHTRYGKNNAMHVPAAAVWLTLAEKDVERLSVRESPGSDQIRVQKGMDVVVDRARGF